MNRYELYVYNKDTGEFTDKLKNREGQEIGPITARGEFEAIYTTQVEPLRSQIHESQLLKFVKAVQC